MPPGSSTWRARAQVLEVPAAFSGTLGKQSSQDWKQSSNTGWCHSWQINLPSHSTSSQSHSDLYKTIPAKYDGINCIVKNQTRQPQHFCENQLKPKGFKHTVSNASRI